MDTAPNISITQQSQASYMHRRLELRFQLDIRNKESASKYRVLPTVDPRHAYDAKKGLKLLGYDEWFSDNQGKSVELVCAGTIDLLAILPTGHGKSLCFLIPSKLYPEKTIIIIVPLTILIQGHVESAHKHGVTTTIWSAATVWNSASQLVFVSSENATCSEFIDYAQTLFTNARLMLIVFDEIHLLFSDWRQKMGDMSAIRRIGAKITMLTATLPPSMEKDLKEKLCFQELYTLRSSTVRPNVVYSVINSNNGVNLLLQLIKMLLNIHLETDDRVIVYFYSTAEVENTQHAIFELGDFDPHHVLKTKTTTVYSRMDANSKNASLSRWKSGENPILLATPVIGCGYDYPMVRTVIHFGMAYDMLSFHQQSGRLSRDGKKGTSILLTNDDYYRKIVHSMEKSSSINRFVAFYNDYVLNKNETCYREIIHRVVDEDNVKCFTTKCALLCGNCEKLKSNTEAAAINEQCGELEWFDDYEQDTSMQVLDMSETYRAREAYAIDTGEFRILMEFLKINNKCLRCLVIANKSHSHHKSSACPQMYGRCFRCYDTTNCRKDYIVDDGCRVCAYPPLFHTEMKYEFGMKCTYPHAEEMRILIWYAFRTAACMKTQFNLLNCSDDTFFSWLIKKDPAHTYNNYTIASMWVVKHYECV